MTMVVVLFLACVIRTVWGIHHDPGFFTLPFYDPANFKTSYLYAGTSVAVLTYIGFDAVSTLSEEVENPRRNIMLATVLLCLIAGLLSGLEVYAAQLIWGSKPFPSNMVESAFAMVSRQAGGMVLFQIINFTLLMANMGSGMGSQLAAGRLLYGMGRGNALPKSFFGVIEPKHRIPRNNILLIGGHCACRIWPDGILLGQAWRGSVRDRRSVPRIRHPHRLHGRQCLFLCPPVAVPRKKAEIPSLWPDRSSSWLSHLRSSSGAMSAYSAMSACWWDLWLVIGIAYGAVRTKGFRSELVNFDIPPDVD